MLPAADPLRRRAGCTQVVGIVNVTPDSFSDGGEYVDPPAAIQQGLTAARAGADWIDVGGESTRPGAERVPPDIEWARVGPVVRSLAAAGCAVSIDTMWASTAAAAVAAGATLVNDVSGGLADPAMLPTVADLGVPIVLMHWRAPSETMDDHAVYRDVLSDVCRELLRRADAATRSGIAAERIVLDPGLGFAKRSAHNWVLLGHLARLVDLGFPVLIGASRKRFLGSLLADDDGPRPIRARDDATVAVTALAAAAGAWGVRVHDVRPSVDAAKVAAAWRAGAGAPSAWGVAG